MRCRTVVLGGVLAAMLGLVAGTGPHQAQAAAPPFRTVLTLNSREMLPLAYYGFGLVGRGEVCSTYFVKGIVNVQPAIGPTPGYEGYLIVIVIDGRGNLVGNFEFRGTACAPLNLPPGIYFLEALRVTGIFHLEVHDILPGQ